MALLPTEASGPPEPSGVASHNVTAVNDGRRVSLPLQALGNCLEKALSQDRCCDGGVGFVFGVGVDCRRCDRHGHRRGRAIDLCLARKRSPGIL